VPRISPDDPAVERVDAALQAWRQGDVALDADTFVHVADGGTPLTDGAAEAGPGLNVVVETAEGVAVLSQTCDIVKSCVRQPFVEVARLVEVEETVAHEIERGYRPNYAVIPALRAKRLVADLDRVMTVEKAVLVSWAREAGGTTDEHARGFAAALARKRSRFAFPDDFNGAVRDLQTHIQKKHDKQNDDGAGLRALREIRVTASPSWDDAAVEIFFWFVRHDTDSMFKGKPWDEPLEQWTKLVPSTGRFTKIEGAVVTLSDMTAQEYVDSDRLDLDFLSARRG